jgi:hypothetical protein
MSFRKDRSLDELARIGNVAQFVSFAPEAGSAAQQFSRVAGHEPNVRFPTNRDALIALLAASSERSINLRSFTPESPQSREFHYGLKSSDDAVTLLDRLLSEGMFVIANETVDVNDGGVSGVIQGGVIEFAPDDTPRCVEKEGTASLPTDLGLFVLNCVYGFPPEVVDAGRGRLEFSIHPKPRGWRQTHTLMWEYEKTSRAPAEARLTWPNRFSRHIGDKAYGLMIADAIGLKVPHTTVISRRVKPFSFGRDTGSQEVWTRTCPREQEPGRFTTAKGWLDPFALLAAEDPKGTSISSILSQAAVPAKFSGAAITDSEGNPVFEGILGEGDAFMLGKKSPEMIPDSILEEVTEVYRAARSKLGPIRFEWVHDGRQAWIVQLHRGGTSSVAATLVPGEASRWEVFEVSNGLEALRRLLHSLPGDVGVRIKGEIGLTSHFADLLRKTNRPSRISSSDPAAAS